MSYFLSVDNLVSDQEVTITGDEARHITLSRRSRPGDVIYLQGPNGKRFEATIHQCTKQGVVCAIGNQVPVPAESPLELTLFQALIAEQALDIILQKATELGTNRVVLFSAQNSPGSLAVAQKKLPRWEKILIEAAKQCDRAMPPRLTIAQTLDGIESLAKELQFTVILDTTGSESKTLPPKPVSTIGLVVGPEGGLTHTELEAFATLTSSTSICLGPRIMRAETAAIAGVTLLQHAYGDM